MKPSLELNPYLLKNETLFDNAFYNRFTLKPHTLQLNDEIAKTYKFPTFYGNVTQSVAIYLCSYDRAKAMMPHTNLVPVKMGGGKTLVIFSCYQYKNVHQVDTYNEIAMTIPVMANPGVNVPVLPMIMTPMFKKFGYYVFSMPVTSLENRIRGHKLWGLPKVVQEISFRTEDDCHICTAKEETGEVYFELKVPVAGKKTTIDEKGFLYSNLDNEMIRAETCFQGEYSINKFMGRLFSSKPVENAYLSLGDTPSGNIIKNLELDSHPFQFRYAENVSSCFDLPDKKNQTFMEKNFS